MANQLYTLSVRDADTIRDQALKTLTAGLRRRGISNPNTGPGSDYYLKFQAFANEAAVAEANGVITVDNQMPDTGDLTTLQRWGAIFGKPIRGAGKASGNVVCSASQPTIITAGTTLTDALQQPFVTTQTRLYSNGDPIPVQAQNGGSGTDHIAGDVLSWSNPPGYCAPLALVGVGGLTGGSDPEDTETYRKRILAQFATPPGNGNWQYVANQAYDASNSVCTAVVYPALQGGATVHVAVSGYTSATTKTRALDPTLVSSVIQPYIAGQIPEHVYLLVTPTIDCPVDLYIGLSIPNAPGASPPGPGGGWTDNNPWPSGQKSFTPTTPFGMVLGPDTTPAAPAPTSTTLYVYSLTSPVANATNVSWLSPINWTLYSATVTSVVNYATNVWEVTLSSPFPSIAEFNCVFPSSANAQTYVNAILQQFALMGPGEKTTNGLVYSRGFRRPTSPQQWPYSLNTSQLKGIINSSSEVNDASYLVINQAGSPNAYVGNTPPVPVTVSGSPYIFTPNNIGFYPM